MHLKKLSSWSNINKARFSIFLWILKKFEVQPKTHIQNPSFEFKDEMKNAMSQFEFHCWK